MTLSTSFRYLAPATRLHVGPGAIGQIRAEAERAGARRAFIVASETVSRTTALVDRVTRALGDLHAGTFTGAKRESPIPTVLAGVEALKAAQADIVVAVGGGSAIVTARAITIVAGEGKTIEEMYTRHVPGKPPAVYRANAPKIPNILVPTTPTTGADRGGAAVWDEAPPHRKELYDPKTRPLAILVDPEALLTAPIDLYLDTSLTTFVGLVDAIQSPDPSALAYADCRQALELCLTYLPKLVHQPEAAGPRIQLFMAAMLANRASQSTFNTQGRARTTGVDRILRYQYPHIGQGASNAVLLPSLLRLNQDVAPEEQARLAAVLRAAPLPPCGGVSPCPLPPCGGVSPCPLPPCGGELERGVSHCVAAFLKQIGAPTRLRDLQVPQGDIPRLAQLEIEAPAFGQGANRISDRSELTRFLEGAW